MYKENTDFQIWDPIEMEPNMTPVQNVHIYCVFYPGNKT